MNNLNNLRVDHSTNNQSSNKKELKKAHSKIDLPLEVLEKIFLDLNNVELQRVNFVSKSWSIASIFTAKNKELPLVKAFSTFVSENLSVDYYPEQRETLLAISTNKEKFENLKQIQSSIHSSNKKILNILKDLKDEDLSKLKNLSKNQTRPKFFEDFFEVTEIDQLVDSANGESDDEDKSNDLRDICTLLLSIENITLLKINIIDKALEIANTIPLARIKSFHLHMISRALLKINRIDKALEIANTIPDTETKNDALFEIDKARQAS